MKKGTTSGGRVLRFALLFAGFFLSTGCVEATFSDFGSGEDEEAESGSGEINAGAGITSSQKTSRVEDGVCGAEDNDSDEDGTPDCRDECPDDPEKTEPGICGCGTSDADSDGDLVADCEDECPADSRKAVAGECGCGAKEGTCSKIRIDDTGVFSKEIYASELVIARRYDASASDKLVVMVSGERDREDSGARIVSVTYGDTPMTEVVQARNYDEGPAAIFYLDDPEGEGDIAIHCNGKFNGFHASWLALSETAPGVGPSASARSLSTTLALSSSLAATENNALAVAHVHVDDADGSPAPTAKGPLEQLLSSDLKFSDAASGYQSVPVPEAQITSAFSSAGASPVIVAAVFYPL